MNRQMTTRALSMYARVYRQVFPSGASPFIDQRTTSDSVNPCNAFLNS